ncbi:MAG: hypothetical protein GYB65_14885 [Chloroflexi bacterium]|nr:hypothetical protein [Chloroflexota bacterium]
MLFRLSVIIVVMIALVLSSTWSVNVQAQGGDEPEECVEFIQQVLTDLGTNCAGGDPFQGCASHPVITLDIDEEETDAYTDDYLGLWPIAEDALEPEERAELDPRDRFPLLPAAQVDASRFDLANEEWGIAKLKVSLPHYPVAADQVEDTVFLAVGARIEDTTTPSDAYFPAAPIDISTTAETALREAPRANADVLDTAPSGVALAVDGISPDGEWARVLFTTNRLGIWDLAWVPTSVLDPTVDTSDLPEVEQDSRVPWQEIFLHDGYEESDECSLAPPSLLLLIGPDEDTAVEFWTNELYVKVRGATLFMIPPSGNVLMAYVAAGVLLVDPDTTDEWVIPAGFWGYWCLSEPDFYGGRVPPEPDEERERVIVPCADGAEFVRRLPDDDMQAWLAALLNPLGEEVPDIVETSGIGGPTIDLSFNNSDAIDPVRDACELGQLPPDICDLYEFPS